MTGRISITRLLLAAAIACTLVCASAVPATAAPVSVGGSGWMWGDPVPQGETLNRVAFQGLRGYAAGEGGTVLRSDDGGNTWLGLASGSQSNLTLLQEVDPKTVVVGGGCTVRESTDEGASFHRLPVNESEQGCATKVAAFSFLGMVLWIYKWFHPNAGLSEEQVCVGMLDLFFNGLVRPAETAA